MIVRAVDQETANAGGAHFGEGDFLAGWLRHGPMMPPIKRTVKPLEVGPSPPGHTRYAARSGKHWRDSLVKLDVDGAGSRVLMAFNKFAETQ
jgi:hypothetical protein